VKSEELVFSITDYRLLITFVFGSIYFKMRRFVIGDIHGAYKALIQCFERSAIDIQTDLLICLGDICDSWPDVDKVFETLLGITNLVMLLGNHDNWALDWFLTRNAPEIWTGQGGDVTVRAYRKNIPATHIELLKNAKLYYILDNKIFVHGGFLPEKDLRLQDKNIFIWDRSLIRTALNYWFYGENIHLTKFDEVYVGHTPTINFDEKTPIKACEIYLMDTGAGWPGGILTMMDIDTKECFYSDVVSELYRGFSGRS
jgi:serine/threonine protein phosphatase 1